MSKEHLLYQFTDYNLSWVNCEMASFIHLRQSNKFYRNPNQEGVVIQSLDVLDFSVIHLSAFERSTHKHRDRLFKNRAEMVKEWHKIDPVIEVGRRLYELNSNNGSAAKVNTLLSYTIFTFKPYFIPVVNYLSGGKKNKL